MERQNGHAELFLNSESVGQVELRGADPSWSFGEFTPNDAFSKYAIHFARWSMLMHEDADQQLHEATSAELRAAEIAIDRLKARLYFPKTDEWERVGQLNIDGSLIEWKHY